MIYDAELGLYVYTFQDVPAANYEYKIAINKSWNENYGAGGVEDGPNMSVSVPETMDVTVYYNDKSHLSATNITYIFADITLSGADIPAGTKLKDKDLSGIYSTSVDMKASTYTDVKLNYNGKDYPQMGTWSEDIARANIEKYMQEAGVSEGDSQLKITFTIAGSNAKDHPTYKVFRDAAALLNSMGWDVEVVCDTQALTKINTGSLEVWAAAWSSALDPDLYQVYHTDSSATSTLAWGYNYLKNSGSAEEMNILNNLSDLIDKARETNDQAERADLYKDAMGYILDLAIELPVYQRSVLYAYNSNVIASDSLPTELNPYTNPLDRIWELKFAE